MFEHNVQQFLGELIHFLLLLPFFAPAGFRAFFAAGAALLLLLLAVDDDVFEAAVEEELAEAVPAAFDDFAFALDAPVAFFLGEAAFFLGLFGLAGDFALGLAR